MTGWTGMDENGEPIFPKWYKTISVVHVVLQGLQVSIHIFYQLNGLDVSTNEFLSGGITHFFEGGTTNSCYFFRSGTTNSWLINRRKTNSIKTSCKSELKNIIKTYLN